MRTLMRLWFMLVAVLLLGSCDLLNVTAPELEDQSYTDAYGITMVVVMEDDLGEDNFVAVVSKDPSLIAGCVLEINGIVEEWDEDDDDWGEGYYYDDVDAAPGESVTYKLTLAKSVYQGVIKIPKSPQLVFSEFNPEDDYTVTWDISEPPEAYLAEYWFNDEYHDDKQLPGDAHSFTIPKNTWFDYNISGIDTNISAINFKNHGDELLVLGWTYGDD